MQDFNFLKIKNFLEMLSPYSERREDLFEKPGNGMFNGADIDILLSFCNCKKPKRILELGSGYSSFFMYESWKRYIDDFILHISIDPSLERYSFNNSKFKRVYSCTEDVDISTLNNFLHGGDLLFIDSGHSYEQAEYYVKNIINKLSKGVYIIIHDIDIIDYNFSKCDSNHAGANSGEEGYIINFVNNNSDNIEVIYSNHIIHHNSFEKDFYRSCMQYKGQNFGALLVLKTI